MSCRRMPRTAPRASRALPTCWKISARPASDVQNTIFSAVGFTSNDGKWNHKLPETNVSEYELSLLIRNQDRKAGCSGDKGQKVGVQTTSNDELSAGIQAEQLLDAQVQFA